MTTIAAKMIADSVSPAGIRLPTLQCRYPLVIHAELMTHRVLSRNARSSRAVPITTMIREVEEDPFVPLHWGATQAGMQAYEECDKAVSLDFLAPCQGRPYIAAREDAWLEARDHAVRVARAFMEAGYAKQLVNRLLAPFLHIDTLVTSTQWDNFFNLRLAPDTEPHMRMLAEAMKASMDASTPQLLNIGVWHLPYINEEDHDTFPVAVLRKLSAARCAAISYKPYSGDHSFDAEMTRAERLAASSHWSPFEHQATPDHTFPIQRLQPSLWNYVEDHNNFVGWRQNRALVEREMREAV